MTARTALKTAGALLVMGAAGAHLWEAGLGKEAQQYLRDNWQGWPKKPQVVAPPLAISSEDRILAVSRTDFVAHLANVTATAMPNCWEIQYPCRDGAKDPNEAIADIWTADGRHYKAVWVLQDK